MDSLHPLVLRFLQSKFTNMSNDKSEQMATMQALVILHAYSQAIPGLQTSPSLTPHQFPQYLLKTLTESYAVHLGFHRSVDSVRAMMRTPGRHLTGTDSYKKYTYWLWLFTMSHQ